MKNNYIRKLPIYFTYVQAIRLCYKHCLSLLLIALPYIALLGIMYLLSNDPNIFKFQLNLNTGILNILLMIVFYLISIMVLVGFHRTFILEANNKSKIKIFRWSKIEQAYLGRWIVVLLILGMVFIIRITPWPLLINLISTRISYLLIPPEFALLIANTIVLFPFYYLAVRAALIFPATAVDSGNKHISTCWELSQGNGWRLVVMLVIIPLIFSTALNYVFREVSSGLLEALYSILINLLLTVEIAVLSLSYQFLANE